MTEIYNNLLETEKSINSINQVQDQDILSKIKINNRKGMNNSKSMDNILKNDEKWAEGIQKYYTNKKILKWGNNPMPEIIKDKYVKSLDLMFNPITQKYSDKNLDNEIKKKEELNLKDTIAKRYDNELRVIQTFDIINLKDKLNVFKNHPNYPKSKIYQNRASKYRKINISSGERNYNILSNIGLDLHHFDKPENRPIIKPNPNQNRKIDNGYYQLYKDYDIISNKYKNYDKEKKDLDKEMLLAENSMKFLNQRNYDLIKGIYVDKEKEQKFQDELRDKMEKIKKRKRDGLFNPFNNEIYDKEKYEELNRKLKNKKYRFSLRSKIENYYHESQLKKDIIENNSLAKKVSYNKFKEIDKRGYDILNGNNNFNHYKNSLSCRNIQRPWEMIKNGVNANQTLKNKKIYVCYDAEDVNQRFKDNDIKRKIMLRNLPKIENEKLFEVNKPNHKIKMNLLKRNQSEVFNRRYEISENNINSFNIDKNTWFFRDKNIFLQI